MKKSIISVLLAVLIAVMCIPMSFALYRGDVDESGDITAEDARTVLRAAVGLDILDAKKKLLADIDDNGTISAEDARSALRMAVGLDRKLEYNTPKSGKTYETPLPADGKTEICYQNYHDKIRYHDITIELKKIICGEAADMAIEQWDGHVNFSDEPIDPAPESMEWRIYIFKIRHVFTEKDEWWKLYYALLFNSQCFYNKSGDPAEIYNSFYDFNKGPYSEAPLSDAYTYQGGSIELAVPLLVAKTEGDLLLRVPRDKTATYTWVELTCDNVVTDYEEDKPENTLSEDDPVNVAAKLWILAQGKVKNPSSFQVHNIYVKDKYVYLWYSANNGFGGAVDGCASAYYDASLETEGYESFYNIEAGDGLIRANVDATLPSTWDSTVSISAVEAQKAIVNTIKYTYKELSY